MATLTLAPIATSVGIPTGTECHAAGMQGHDHTLLDPRTPDATDGWAFCIIPLGVEVPRSHQVVTAAGTVPEDQRPGAQFKTRWQQALGRPFMGDTVADAITNLFTTQADETANTYAPPLDIQPGKRFGDIHLGPRKLRWLITGLNDAKALPLLKRLRRDYAQWRQRDVPFARSMLKRMVEKYRLNGRQFEWIQGQFTSDGDPLPHNTTITDDFSSDTSANYNAYGSWTITGGQLKANANQHLRFVHKTSLGTDHYSQCDISTNKFYPGAHCRSSSTAEGFAFYWLNSTQMVIRRYSASSQTFTTVSTLSHTNASGTQTLRIDASGSTISSTNDAAAVHSLTDTNFATNTDCGMFCFGTDGRMDDFEAGDLGGISIPVVMHHRRLIGAS